MRVHLSNQTHSQLCVDCLTCSTFSADDDALRFFVFKELLVSKRSNCINMWLFLFESEFWLFRAGFEFIDDILTEKLCQFSKWIHYQEGMTDIREYRILEKS